jgi:putative ABC transport system permease protein
VTSFTLAMARREGRGSRRRLALYMSSITIGVAALVAINSFRKNVTAAISGQAREVLGADLELSSRRAFDSIIQGVLDSTARSGVPVSRVTSFASMALATRSGGTRLVEVRAIEGGYPYYGAIETQPPEAWARLSAGRSALVDPAVLIQLGAAVGDTLAVGEGRFVIIGSVLKYPGDIALRTAIGPRVYIPAAYLEGTQLLRTGSLARYYAYLKLEPPAEVQRFLNRHNQTFRQHNVGSDTVAERERELTNSLDILARFLGLVGLVALLLGGVGVASAVNVFATEKLEIAAILRCLGATQGTVFAIYLLQAGAMGLVGAAAGVALGVIVQWQLPRLLADFLPIAVPVGVDYPSIMVGLGIGVWVAVVFALLPLLSIRDVSPLAALRKDYEPAVAVPRSQRVTGYVAVAGSILALSLWQAPRMRSGLAFAVGVATTTLLLWISAGLLTRAVRRFFPRRARYEIRQGVANLFRPHNQTTAVTLAVGFGIFLIATLYVVQRNLLDQLELDARPDRPNLVLFDIQRDQIDGARALLRERGLTRLQETPIVTARIAAINGQTVQQLLAAPDGYRRARWALRREYRNTYRDTLVATEELVAGQWWDAGAAGAGGAAVDPAIPSAATAASSAPPPISVEQDLASELGVTLGDRITWDVQGIQIETRIASVRRVTWARFEPNFFVVFAPGVLDAAPHSFVVLTRVSDRTARAEVQRDLVMRYPNIAAVDLTLLQETLDSVLGSVSLSIRFMALFSIVSGLLVLIGAIATTRFQRMRESVLLKTLGASQRQIIGITLTEYSALGALAGLTGVLLASVAGWALMRFFFEVPFRLPSIPLGALAVGAALITMVVGLANSWYVFGRTPLAMLREMGE